MAKQDELVFLPLGGVGEIGMNLALYGYGPADHRQWIMVDCGVTFPGPDLPGVDLVLPDIRFLANERKNLKAIIITHAHEDHYGALADLWPGLNVPVYASPFTAGLLEAKRNFEKDAIGEVPVTIFKAGDKINAGPFSIEGVAVNHSIPEPMSLMIRTPLGNVIHTGDWKIDHEPSLGPLTDETRFRQLGDEGVLALLCDSTNALRDGVSPSEKDVSESLRKIIENAEGRVAITTFSSNVGRIRTVAEAAEAAGREVLLLGSSLKRVCDVAQDIGLLEGVKPFISEEDYGFIPRDKVVVILTGSQGEPRAALAKLSRDEMRNVAFAAGDIVVFSSRAIPGNEKAIQDIKKDGSLIGDFDEMGIGERKKLAYVGHVAVSIVLDNRYDIIGEPDLVAIGLPAYDDEGEDMEDTLFDAAISAIESIPRARRKDIDMVQEAARRAVRAAANNAWGKKPVVTVFITRV
jgi:ribonuclease J